MEAENLIFEGEGSITHKTTNPKETLELVQNLKLMIIDYLRASNHEQQGVVSLSGLGTLTGKYFHLNFSIPCPIEISSLSEKFQEKYRVWLSSIKNSAPDRIGVSIEIDGEGFKVKISSKSAVYRKIDPGVVGFSTITSDEYSCIRAENIQFIKDLLSAIHAKVIRPPNALSQKTKFRLSDELRTLGHTEIANLLDRGYSHINSYDSDGIENGLVDLRDALDKFVKIMADLVNNGKHKDKFKENLMILQEKGYLDEKMANFLHKTLYEFVYSYLSNVTIHNREKLVVTDKDRKKLLGEYDAKYVYALFEDSMEYLLNKVIKRV
jgi:hypothetical protein